MARKRSHKNSSRLTARERATEIAEKYWPFYSMPQSHCLLRDRIQRAIQAAVRQARERKERRAK
jgi:hypothetical protein